MSNTSDKQLTFEDFLGEGMYQFNKDDSTSTPYTERDSSIDHIDTCDCDKCEAERSNASD